MHKFPNIDEIHRHAYPCKMSFRSDPLPSYEDIISGNFLNLKSAASKPTETENITETNAGNFLSVEEKFISSGGGEFKYKTVNKIIENEDYEDGEIKEDGEIAEAVIKCADPKNKSNNKRDNKNDKNAKNNKNPNTPKDALKVQKPEAQKKNNNNKAQANFTSNTTSTVPNGKTPFVPRLICRYFMEGICSKGDKCTFSHAVVPNKTPEEAKVKEPCKFFIAGSCMKGESCYYSHDLSVVPCKFFHLKGECSANAKGAVCRFSHEPIDKETLEILRLSEAERIKEKQAAEALITATTKSLPESLSATKPENTQTSKETEASTDCPHDADLLNPFAGDDNDEDY